MVNNNNNGLKSPERKKLFKNMYVICSSSSSSSSSSQHFFFRFDRPLTKRQIKKYQLCLEKLICELFFMNESNENDIIARDFTHVGKK